MDRDFPLAEGSQVTMLGIRSEVSLLGSCFGVKANGPYISLEQALTQNQTDFKNTIAYSLNNDHKTALIVAELP